jgi:hypothetical protein
MSTTVIALIAAAVAIGSALSDRKGPSLPTKRRRIAALDLAPVRRKAMKRHRWSKPKARSLEADYRDFLILIAENGGKTISPWTDDLDLFWHEHILDTARYAKDCRWIFGRFIQHDPHVDRNPYRHESTKQSTIALREAQLEARAERRRVPGPDAFAHDGFDIATWGCAAAPREAHGSHGGAHAAGGSWDYSGGEHSSGHHGTAGDHGSGGHDGGGHDGGGGHDAGGGHDGGGGHSCGGHSCGGHGCGSGQ